MTKWVTTCPPTTYADPFWDPAGLKELGHDSSYAWPGLLQIYWSCQGPTFDVVLFVFQLRIDKDGHSYFATLEIQNVTVEDAGKYKVTAKNELGESNATISLNFDSKCCPLHRLKSHSPRQKDTSCIFVMYKLRFLFTNCTYIQLFVLFLFFSLFLFVVFVDFP